MNVYKKPLIVGGEMDNPIPNRTSSFVVLTKFKSVSLVVQVPDFGPEANRCYYQKFLMRKERDFPKKLQVFVQKLVNRRIEQKRPIPTPRYRGLSSPPNYGDFVELFRVRVEIPFTLNVR